MLGCSLDGKILRSHLKRQRVNSAHSSVDKETRRTPLRDNEGQLWLKKLKTFNENQWFCLDTNICGKDFFSFKERKGQKKLAELAHLWISIRHDMSTTADVLSWPETDPCSCVFTGKPLYQICEMCHFNWSKKKSFTPSQIFRAVQHLHSSKPFSPDTGEGCRLLNTSFCTLLYECEISHENLSEADNKLRSFRINYIFVTDGGVLLSFEGKTAINSKYSHQQELKTRIAQGEGKKSEKGRAIMMERTRNGAARAQTGAQGGDERWQQQIRWDQRKPSKPTPKVGMKAAQCGSREDETPFGAEAPPLLRLCVRGLRAPLPLKC